MLPLPPGPSVGGSHSSNRVPVRFRRGRGARCTGRRIGVSRRPEACPLPFSGKLGLAKGIHSVCARRQGIEIPHATGAVPFVPLPPPGTGGRARDRRLSPYAGGGGPGPVRPSQDPGEAPLRGGARPLRKYRTSL